MDVGHPSSTFSPPLNYTPNAEFEKVSDGCAVRTKPQTADASRDIIWQGNCHVLNPQLCSDSTCSNVAFLRITISIEYPISNCPAKSGAASFLRLYPKRPGPAWVLLLGACPPGCFR